MQIISGTSSTLTELFYDFSPFFLDIGIIPLNRSTPFNFLYHNCPMIFFNITDLCIWYTIFKLPTNKRVVFHISVGNVKSPSIVRYSIVAKEFIIYLNHRMLCLNSSVTQLS